MNPEVGDIWRWSMLGESAVLFLLEKRGSRFFCQLMWQSDDNMWKQQGLWDFEDYNRRYWRKLA